MRLMTPKAWVEKYFVEGSRPPGATMRRWLRDGVLPSKKIGGSWFIDEDAWLTSTGDPKVDALVRKVLASN